MLGCGVTETIDRVAVLRRALEILQDRGWASRWSQDNDGPLNIRCAISKACSELVGYDQGRLWYDCYLDSVHGVATYLKRGIIDWEAKVKAPVEVEVMLTEVINRLENDDIKPRKHRPRYSGL